MRSKSTAPGSKVDTWLDRISLTALVVALVAVVALALTGCATMEALGSAISDPETTNAAWESFRENTPANPLDWVSWLYAVGGALAAGGAVATKKFLEKKKNGSDPVN